MGERADEIRERYRRDGYVVRDILAMAEVEALRAEIAAVCRGERGEVRQIGSTKRGIAILRGPEQRHGRDAGT